MNNSSHFLIMSLLYIIVLTFIYKKKKHIESFELNIFNNLLSLNIFGLLIELLCIYNGLYSNPDSFFNLLVNKSYLLYLLFFCTLFLKYAICVSLGNENYEIHEKKISNYLLIFTSIFSVLIIVLPLNIVIDKYMYSKGPSIVATYVASLISIVVSIYFMAKNYKSLKIRKYLPLIVLIVGLGVASVIQKIYPGFTMITVTESFVLFIMYFTIENPDVKVIETLNENRKLIEKTNEEKLNILFELQQKTKEPIKNIQDISNLMLNENNKDNLKEMAKQVNTSSKELMLLSNNVFDISNMDISNIKLALGFYDVKLLFKEIEKRVQEEIQGDVELRTNYTDLIDAKLYGDKVKLKQVLISILNNSLKQTKKGFIEIKVNSIVKYDVCRLIISISDSGCGIGVEEVNRILSANYMEQEDFKKLDKVDVGIEMANKIIKVLGGTLIVRSEINKGSEYLIIIDQKIKENKDKINFNQIDTRGKRKILIVNENLNEAKQMEEQLIKLGIDVTMVLYGKGAIEKIKNGEEYDMIIVDDEMRLQSGYDTLKKLQTIKKFKTPVLISIDDDKKFLVSKYIEDGFKDYILKSNLNEEIKKVNKYL